VKAVEALVEEAKPAMLDPRSKGSDAAAGSGEVGSHPSPARGGRRCGTAEGGSEKAEKSEEKDRPWAAPERVIGLTTRTATTSERVGRVSDPATGL
jgi:hypothetical protein